MKLLAFIIILIVVSCDAYYYSHHRHHHCTKEEINSCVGWQEFNNHNCECYCPYSRNGPKNRCPENKFWNYPGCHCDCIANRPKQGCPKHFHWSKTSCACKSDFEGATIKIPPLTPAQVKRREFFNASRNIYDIHGEYMKTAWLFSSATAPHTVARTFTYDEAKDVCASHGLKLYQTTNDIDLYGAIKFIMDSTNFYKRYVFLDGVMNGIQNLKFKNQDGENMYTGKLPIVPQHNGQTCMTFWKVYYSYGQGLAIYTLNCHFHDSFVCQGTDSKTNVDYNNYHWKVKVCQHGKYVEIKDKATGKVLSTVCNRSLYDNCAWYGLAQMAGTFEEYVASFNVPVNVVHDGELDDTRPYCIIPDHYDGVIKYPKLF